MTFQIDTGTPGFEPHVYSSGIDDTQAITFLGRGTDAERKHRQIIENIEAFDDEGELDQYFEAEELIIDALHIYHPQYAEEVVTAYEDHRMHLTGIYLPVHKLSAQAGIPREDVTQSKRPERAK